MKQLHMANPNPSRTLVLYGHSHVRRLHHLGQSQGIPPNLLFNQHNHQVIIEGYGDLSFERVLDDPDWYLRNLVGYPIDVLCVDLGTNGLCDIFSSPAQVVDQLADFIQTMSDRQIHPTVLVFLTQLIRTEPGSNLNLPGMVTLATYINKVSEYNDRLQNTLSTTYPFVNTWTQDGYNTPQFITGRHLNPAGTALRIQNLTNMFGAMVTLRNTLL